MRTCCSTESVATNQGYHKPLSKQIYKKKKNEIDFELNVFSSYASIQLREQGDKRYSNILCKMDHFQFYLALEI